MRTFIFTRPSSSAKNDEHFVRIEAPLALSITALGATAIVAQIILLREFLSIFYGNELVIGIILANWMILTGCGSFLGRLSDKIENPINAVIAIIILLGVLPVVTVFFLRYLRNIVFDVGGMIGIIQVLCSSFILLMPFCLISGFAFTLFSHTISEKYKSNLIPNVYSLEALGSLIGGLAFSLVMAFFLETFQSLFIMAIFDFMVVFVLAFKYGTRRTMIVVISLAAVIFFSGFSINLDELTRKFLFYNQEILYYKDTPYGNVTITAQKEQKNFYENNVLLFSTNDPAANEEAVHFAMIQRPDAEKVLLISGGISGTTDEILKYPVSSIVYVEINPSLTEIGKSYKPSLSNPKIVIINKDARLYIRSAKEHYDVALINLPDPNTAQVNRYYTEEFFRELKAKLNKNAVISLGLTSSADYLSGEARQLKSVIYNTLKTSFKNILIVAGTKDYFLASDGSLDIHIARMIGQRAIKTLFVNKYYLDDALLDERQEFILSNISGIATVNRDFTPVSYYSQLLLWLSYFELNYWLIILAGVLIIFFLLRKLNPITLGVFTGGLAASSLEIILLLAFQIIYGFVYRLLGIIITIFMAGLAVGSLYRHKIIGNSNINGYIAVQFGIGLLSCALPFFLLLIKSWELSIGILYPAFFLPTFIIAVLIGMEFSIASHLQKGTAASAASQLYGIDLIGSAIGALLVTTIFIPLLGIIKASLVIGGLSFASAIVAFFHRRNYTVS
jgi:spermidine synthase